MALFNGQAKYLSDKHPDDTPLSGADLKKYVDSMRTHLGRITQDQRNKAKSGASGLKLQPNDRDASVIRMWSFVDEHIVRHRASKGGVSINVLHVHVFLFQIFCFYVVF